MTPEEIKEVALSLARESGLINLTRETLCEAVQIPVGSFPNIMGRNFTDFINELVTEVGESGFRHTVTTKRANSTLRKIQILNVALDLSKDVGYQFVTRSAIAKRAGLSEGSINLHFSTMTQLKRDIMRAAVKQEVHEIVAQGLAANDKQAKKAEQEVKDKALKFLAG
jgi:hypothetical protein